MIGESTDTTFNHDVNNKKVENFHLRFTHLPFHQISFDYDEVLTKIYKTQKKQQNRLKTDEVIEKIARVANLKRTDFRTLES